MFSLKLIHSLLFILLLSILILRCSEPTEPNSSPSVIIPLKIGNTWNYSRTVYDSTGFVYYTDNIISSVQRDTIINYTKWYGFTDAPGSVYFTNKLDGYWALQTIAYPYFPNDTSFIVYEYPAHVGDIYGSPNSPREVVSVDEHITVSAGEFEVIHIVTTFIGSNNYQLDSYEIYITPGIGIIKRMQLGKKYDGTKFVVYKYELENYTLK